MKKVLLPGEVGKTTTAAAAAGNRHRIGIRRREGVRLDPARGDHLLVEDRHASSILVVQRVPVGQASRAVLLLLLLRAIQSRSDCSTRTRVGLHFGQAGVLFLRGVEVRKVASVLRTRKQRREELQHRTESEEGDRAGEAAAAAGGGTAACFRTLSPQTKTKSRTSCACKAERRASLNRVLLLLWQSSLGCMVLQREVLLLRTGTWRLRLLLAERRRRSRRRTGPRWQRRRERLVVAGTAMLLLRR